MQTGPTMMEEEHYDPSKPVCDNQADFDIAFRKAITYNNKQSEKKAKPWMYVYLVLWLIFIVWALLLAMQVAPGHERIEHLVFAIVFSPVYVLAYYVGALSSNKGMGFSRHHY